MSITTYYAQNAIVYTKKALGLLPSNHPLMRFITSDKSRECVKELRDDPDYNYKAEKNTILQIKHIAERAKSRRCGNCGEHAAVAFVYLMTTYCPYMIEYAQYQWPGDHAFVIIGRDPDSLFYKPLTWGSTAVVADAWSFKVVPSLRYYSDMPSGWSMPPKILAHYNPFVMQIPPFAMVKNLY